MSEKEQSPNDSEGESQGQVITKEKPKVKKPNLYGVILLNDDYTPMDFVVWLLQTVFHKPLNDATRLMLDVHTKGKGLAGVFTYDVAQTKVFEVNELARKYQHPLECIMEVIEGN